MGRLRRCGIVFSIGFLLIIGGSALAQDTPPPSAVPATANPQPSQVPENQTPENRSPENPAPQNQAPEEKKEEKKKAEGSNPAQGAAEKKKGITTQAVGATKNLGELALVKARDRESSWLTGVYVERGRATTPLTGKQRRDLYLQQTLATPGAYMKRMFAAGIDQARGAPSQWDDGWGGYAERFASREGQFISANSVAAWGNAKLKYEPRYDQCQCSGFWPRARHAIMRNFLTYNQSEQELRPQWALYGGAFGGGLISTAWKAHPRNAFAEGGRAMAGQAAYGSLLNLFIEFAGDINRKIGAKEKK